MYACMYVCIYYQTVSQIYFRVTAFTLFPRQDNEISGV